jgi:hypothetical protein
MLSLLDMFSVYHQIRVRREDEEKTSFITPFGTFCFVRMPEGLKNAGCTFSKMIAIVLHHRLRRNILAYVDDIVFKSIQIKDHIIDLSETFANLRAANLRLNPEKFVFGIHKGKGLGCLVSTEGIKENPDKIKALIEMQDPISVKDVQKLIGRVAALNRFIPRAAERSLAFFQVLRSSKNYQWSESQKQAVTEPPKIIPYYRLSRSTWPLSNNKELLSRFCRVKPGKSHTTGSLICAKPTRRRDQSTTLHYIKGSQVQHYYKPGLSYIKGNMVQSLNSGK